MKAFSWATIVVVLWLLAVSTRSATWNLRKNHRAHLISINTTSHVVLSDDDSAKQQQQLRQDETEEYDEEDIQRRRLCVADSGGNFGILRGNVPRMVIFYYQAVFVNGTSQSQVTINILPKVERTVVNGVLPSLFFCPTDLPREQVLGISSETEDQEVALTCHPRGEGRGECLTFQGKMGIFSPTLSTEEAEALLRPMIQLYMELNVVELLSLDPRFIDFYYVEVSATGVEIPPSLITQSPSLMPSLSPSSMPTTEKVTTTAPTTVTTTPTTSPTTKLPTTNSPTVAPVVDTRQEPVVTAAPATASPTASPTGTPVVQQPVDRTSTSAASTDDEEFWEFFPLWINVLIVAGVVTCCTCCLFGCLSNKHQDEHTAYGNSTDTNNNNEVLDLVVEDAVPEGDVVYEYEYEEEEQEGFVDEDGEVHSHGSHHLDHHKNPSSNAIAEGDEYYDDDDDEYAGSAGYEPPPDSPVFARAKLQAVSDGHPAPVMISSPTSNRGGSPSNRSQQRDLATTATASTPGSRRDLLKTPQSGSRRDAMIATSTPSSSNISRRDTVVMSNRAGGVREDSFVNRRDDTMVPSRSDAIAGSPVRLGTGIDLSDTQQSSYAESVEVDEDDDDEDDEEVSYDVDEDDDDEEGQEFYDYDEDEEEQEYVETYHDEDYDDEEDPEVDEFHAEQSGDHAEEEYDEADYTEADYTEADYTEADYTEVEEEHEDAFEEETLLDLEEDDEESEVWGILNNSRRSAI